MRMHPWLAALVGTGSPPWNATPSFVKYAGRHIGPSRPCRQPLIRQRIENSPVGVSQPARPVEAS
jgi:hypothetical protein